MKFDLARLDRRIIYVLVLLALAIPILRNLSLPAARMRSAEAAFSLVESIKPQPHQLVLMVLDFGPNSMAENLPQAEVVLEHLMRRRIPVALMSQYVLAEPFLTSIPEQVAARLNREQPAEHWSYGTDWVNLGFRPGGALMIQNLAKSDNIIEVLNNDARGNLLGDLPLFNGVKTLADVPVLVQMTSLVGTLDVFLQFFKRSDFRPQFLHGCTSITIPQAFIYLDSGQLKGLLEGIAGAAWYSTLLKRHYPNRAVDTSLVVNTSLGVAHLVIIALIVLGNLAVFLTRRSR